MYINNAAPKRKERQRERKRKSEKGKEERKERSLGRRRGEIYNVLLICQMDNKNIMFLCR